MNNIIKLLIIGLLVGMICLSENGTVNASDFIVEEQNITLGNITFIFKNNLELNGRNVSGWTSGFNSKGAAEVYMSAGKNIYLNDTEGVKQLCQHELCHVYLAADEDICRGYSESFWECEELKILLK